MEEHREKHLSAAAGDASTSCSWSEEVEDLLAAGDRDAAISLLESAVSELTSQEESSSTCLQLSSALQELARIYSAAGFSLKADQLHSRALVVKQRALHASSPSGTRDVGVDGKEKDLKGVEDAETNAGVVCRSSIPEGSTSSLKGHAEQSMELPGSGNDASLSNGVSDDDWEAIADREPNDLLPSECLPDLSKVSLEDEKPHGPKRRGRGTFSYKKHELYSDQLSDDSANDEEKDEHSRVNSEENAGDKHSKYGTHHVLVLTDFPPSTKTMELEKLLEDFRGRGVVIRWVNDTTALAVFRSPATGWLGANCFVHSVFRIYFVLSSLLIYLFFMQHLRPATAFNSHSQYEYWMKMMHC
ncbi:uncharacterized protein LOC116200943 isoform X2 [Punica granatum]|uniref:Uncharacterized protein LOC116200943 isoform X2 n=1 Tax=Punica granatum TaxID=22663 RepID=A0A6P8CV42_PUNGR|nr:uncharacterized protein LOC116200943 isoform X2 [Punica granatum]